MKRLIRIAAAALTSVVLCLDLYIELAPQYLVKTETKLIFAAAIVILLGISFFFGAPEEERSCKMRDYLKLLFLYYLWVLANVLFFDKAFGRGFTKHAKLEAVNFEPFRTIKNYLLAYHNDNISLRLVVINLLGNLAAFGPMGFFLPALYKWQRSIFFFTATLTLSIITVEVTQVYSGAGSCDVDDLILNLTGALIVYVICRVTPIWKHICSINEDNYPSHSAKRR